MPEGHTIHRLARDLNSTFKGLEVQASSPQGVFADGAARLDGLVCDRFDAYGKHLVGRFGADVLHIHLGLIGKLRREEGEPVGAVRLRLSRDDTHWDLRGPMVCTVGDPELADSVAQSVGPDPLRRSAKPDEFVAGLQRRKIAIGAALLDQKLLAGIGNVYRSELLFLSGIDPLRPANSLSEKQALELWDLTVAQLRVGLRLNRIVTVDPALVGYRSPGRVPDEDRLYVYKREGEPCRQCGTEIELLEVAKRKMWRCPKCQS